jgi:hypothetical protein
MGAQVTTIVTSAAAGPQLLFYCYLQHPTAALLVKRVLAQWQQLLGVSLQLLTFASSLVV